ncbi:uncharacterized protein LOC101755302 isoform X2 [Setaria italica]|uniref:uncharacterized protein LOC101755302 isoform X2 n=1 Tax=Setaria italica TaxID=4555 RepID=UPI000350A5EF|nr:uncharacterized protein LOC101755302 isoform X2 [Setaria italica]
MRGRGHGGVAEVEDLRRRPWSRRLRHHLPAPATAPLVPGPGSFQRRSSPSGDRASAQARRRSGRRGTGSARSLQIGGMHSTRTKGEYSPSGSNPTHSVLNQTRDDEGPTHSNPPRPGNQTHDAVACLFPLQRLMLDRSTLLAPSAFITTAHRTSSCNRRAPRIWPRTTPRSAAWRKATTRWPWATRSSSAMATGGSRSPSVIRVTASRIRLRLRHRHGVASTTPRRLRGTTAAPPVGHAFW